MSRQAVATHNTITLKGSTKIVTEFFGYAVNRCGQDQLLPVTDGLQEHFLENPASAHVGRQDNETALQHLVSEGDLPLRLL